MSTNSISIKKQNKFSRFLPLYLMALPGLLYLFINNYLPMFGLIIAFKDLDFSVGILKSEWVGFENFKYLFTTPDAFIITRNTLLFNIVFIILNTTMGIVLAIIMNEVKNRYMSRIYQAIVLLPMLISMVIVSYLVLALLNKDLGFLNKSILPLFGIQPVDWYAEPKPWIIILPLVQLWKGVGFNVIIYLSTIVGIDRELYEAATIDGASYLQRIQKITLPLLTPVIIMTTTIAIGRIFRSDFGLFYQVPLDSGALYDVTNVIDTYVYRGLMRLGDISMSSAAGLYQSVVGFILVLASNAFVKKISPENSMF